MPCSQKHDTELPNYGRNMPLPGQQAPPETVHDPLESHLLTEEFLVPELTSAKEEALLGVSDKEPELLDVSDKNTELLVSKESDILEEGRDKSTEAEILVIQDGQIVQKVTESVISDIHSAVGTNDIEVGDDCTAQEISVESVRVIGESQQPVPVSEYFTSCQVRVLYLYCIEVQKLFGYGSDLFW